MTHAPALTVTVTFDTVVFPVFEGALVDWFAGKQDADTERAAICELRGLERKYQEVYSARIRRTNGRLERDTA